MPIGQQIQQLIATTNPIVLIAAGFLGLIAFFVFRLIFRMLHFVFHLGCLVIVAVAAFFILRNMIK